MLSNIPNESFIEVPGGSLFVKVWYSQTPNDLAPIILLHDSLGCVETWRDFPAHLAKHLERTVIAYDRLGFGKSSARTALPSFDFIREEGEIYLPVLLKKLGIQECVLFDKQ